MMDEEKNKTSSKKRIIFIVIVACGIFAICFFSTILPNIHDNRAKQNAINRINGELQSVADDYGIDLIYFDRINIHEGTINGLFGTFITSDSFSTLAEQEMYSVFKEIESSIMYTKFIVIDSNGYQYFVGNNKKQSNSSFKDLYLYARNKQDGSIKSLCLYSNKTSNSGGNSGSNSNVGKKKCEVCNGTGYVRYYYGDSDLQAVLEGHDTYTTGPCTSCKGTGWVDK